MHENVRRVDVIFGLILFCGICLCSLAFSKTAYGETLKVIDHHGQTRAMKQVVGPSSVTVTVAGKDRVQVSLASVDRVENDIQGELKGSGTYVFRGLKGGIWRVVIIGADASIKNVSIQSK